MWYTILITVVIDLGGLLLVYVLLRDRVPAYQPPSGDDPIPAYLGIDVGSVSTNVVAIDEFGTVIHDIYLRTAGRPIEAVQQGLSELERLASKRPGPAASDGAAPPSGTAPGGGTQAGYVRPPGPGPVKAPAQLEARPAAAPAVRVTAPEHLTGANESFARPPAQADEGRR